MDMPGQQGTSTSSANELPARDERATTKKTHPAVEVIFVQDKVERNGREVNEREAGEGSPKQSGEALPSRRFVQSAAVCGKHRKGSLCWARQSCCPLRIEARGRSARPFKLGFKEFNLAAARIPTEPTSKEYPGRLVGMAQASGEHGSQWGSNVRHGPNSTGVRWEDEALARASVEHMQNDATQREQPQDQCQ